MAMTDGQAPARPSLESTDFYDAVIGSMVETWGKFTTSYEDRGVIGRLCIELYRVLDVQARFDIRFVTFQTYASIDYQSEAIMRRIMQLATMRFVYYWTDGLIEPRIFGRRDLLETLYRLPDLPIDDWRHLFRAAEEAVQQLSNARSV